MTQTHVQCFGGPLHGRTIEKPKASKLVVPTQNGGAYIYELRQGVNSEYLIGDDDDSGAPVSVN